MLDQFNTLNNCYSIILLRCPYSNFSSVWKVYNKKKIRLIEIVKLWKIYAKIFIDNTNFIKVLYDEYCSNDNYVINTLKKLDIDVKEIKKDKYIQYQDSSFKTEIEKKRTYDTLKTSIYKNDTTFVKLVEDKEIYNLWNVIIRFYI